MQQPATVIVAPAPQVMPAQQQCSCRVPDNVSTHVKGARAAVIAIIVIHAVALLAAGWWMWNMWLASLIAFIMGGIQLCMFTKCTYMVAGSLYIVGCIFDIIAMAFWISVANIADDANDDVYDDWGEHLGWFALPAAIGAVGFLIAAVYTWLAICNWHLSGAPDAIGVGVPMAGGVQVMAPNHTVQTTDGKAQPPPYAANV